MAEFLHVRKTKFYGERRTVKTNDYKSLYRFSEGNVEKLVQYFLGNSPEKRGGALSSKQRMEIFLRYMADPGFQIGVGEDSGVHRTTVTKTIKFVMEQIINKSQCWIKYPKSTIDILEAKTIWDQKYQFVNAIGAIDCTHIPIEKPTIHGDEYINRKGYASINVQATCNAHEVFTSVDAQWPGSVHDSRILKMSPLYRFMLNVNNCVVLGDLGYGITPWLMTPYKNPITDVEKNYNKIHTKERVVIERCFGQLKRRFTILKYGVRTALEKVPQIIICCFVLHNVAKHLQDSDADFETVESESESDDEFIDENDELDARSMRTAGQEKRTYISRFLFDNRNE